jgi:outer membrane protein OmpA-like peptidoglycan-associated protein
MKRTGGNMTRHLGVMLALSLLWVTTAAGQASQKAPTKSASKPAAARVNVTGTWSSNLPGGPDLKLFQEGDLVWGEDHLNEGGVRGLWSDGRLMLVYTDSVVDQNNPGCGPRTALVLKSKGTATRLDGIGFDLSAGNKQEKYLTRNTPDPGADFAYPYDQELKRCGDLFTWELAFESDSDQLKGTDWPVLAKLSDLLKKEQALKIKVAGHTDSTGDAAHNQDLSLRRAETVKKTLIAKYGADENRITTKGWGADQPLVDNGTEEGRAINRRVEILIAR